MGLPSKILFVGAHLNPRPAGSTLPNGGVCFENWARASKQNLLLGALGLPVKLYLWVAHPCMGPAGSNPTKGGIIVYALRILRRLATKIATRGRFA